MGFVGEQSWTTSEASLQPAQGVTQADAISTTSDRLLCFRDLLDVLCSNTIVERDVLEMHYISA